MQHNNPDSTPGSLDLAKLPLADLEQHAKQYIRLKKPEQARPFFLALGALKQPLALNMYVLAINTCLKCYDKINARQLLEQGLQAYPDSAQLLLLKARDFLNQKKLKANAVALFKQVFLIDADLLGIQDLIRFRELMYLASLEEEMASQVQVQFFTKLANANYDELTKQNWRFEFYLVSNQLEAAKTLFDTALMPNVALLKKKHLLLYINLLKAMADHTGLCSLLNDQAVLNEHGELLFASLFSSEEQQAIRDDIVLLQTTRRYLLADEMGYRIEYYQQHVESDYLFICFNGVMGHKKHRTFGLDFMLRQGFDVMTINAAMQCNYQQLSLQAFEAIVLPVSEHKKRVYTYGHSLGAYMALYYAGAVNATVIASAPRHPNHPLFYRQFADPLLMQSLITPYQHQELVDVAKTSQAVFIFYDPFEKKDQFMLDELVLPAYPNAQICRLPHVTHSTVVVLKELGLLKDFILTMVYEQRFLSVDLSGLQATEKMLLAMLRDYAGQQEHADTIVIADRLLALNPQHAEAYLLKVEALLAQDNQYSARQALYKALDQISQKNSLYYNQLGLLREILKT